MTTERLQVLVSRNELGQRTESPVWCDVIAEADAGYYVKPPFGRQPLFVKKEMVADVEMH